jgi:uncharacterized membrane protein
MDRLLHILATHWFGGVLAVVAVLLGVLLLLRRRRGTWSFPLILFGCTFSLLGIGGLALPAEWGLWLAMAALAVLAVMLLVVFLSGHWWAPLGYGVGAVLLLGIGGWVTVAASEALSEVGRVVLSLGVNDLGWVNLFNLVSIPLWLLPLALLPLIVVIGFRSLAGLGPVRRWLAIGLRCAILLLLILALLDVRVRHANESMTVLFLIDRSLSIPPEYDGTDSRVDQRWERIKRFINDAVEKRPPGHERDKAGIIVFGRRPRLEVPPSDARRINFTEVGSNIDSSYTDIAAAIKLALASFPEGAGKRIVLFSDGNENLGDAVEQARIARHNGVQIDVVPLATGQHNESEVLVQAIEAPPMTEQGARLPIRVLIRSYNPLPVQGTLTLRQLSDGETIIVGGKPLEVRLRPGLNSIPFQQVIKNREQSYTYEAIFQPKEVLTAEGRKLRDYLPGEDRVENNRATTHVVALGRRRILVIEPQDGDHQLLIDHLKRLGKSKYEVRTTTVERLPQNKADLALLLSSYDCVILANVPASDVAADDPNKEVDPNKVPVAISDEQQEVIRSNTHDQGCGLIMIGGPYSFGAGGWQGTPVEKALPVDCDIKSMKVEGKGGLVLIMHGAEMAEGNRWEREIAKLAIKKLSPMDMVGVLHWDDFSTAKWHIDFQEIGKNRENLIRKVDKMHTGDMADVNPALQKAFDALTKPANDLATRHVIFISDGDHWQADNSLLSKMRRNRITCTTVCITTHGMTEVKKMSSMAIATGGRFYNVKSPKALPAIYTKETRLLSQPYIHDKPFKPTLHYQSGPTDQLPKNLPALYGFVRTTAKPSALVEMPIEGPPTGEQRFPILAYWHYGLGKAVAFTSDARSLPAKGRLGWDRDWAGSDMYLKFWEQVVDWSLRAVETGRLSMSTEFRDGKVKVTIDARDDKNRPLTDLQIRGAITPPSARAEDARKLQMKFEQKNSGIYEGEFKADEAGSYFINAVVTRRVPLLKAGQPVFKPGQALAEKDREIRLTGKGDRLFLADGTEVRMQNDFLVLRDGRQLAVEVRQEPVDSIRSGVSIPYSPEFADMESNTALLDKLSEITGGVKIPEDGEALTEAARSGEVFRAGLPRFRSLQPIWFWLLLAAGILLCFDVAVRRIAIEPLAVAVAAQRVWGRLRRQDVVAESSPQFLDRLKSRKEQIGQALDRGRATQRFDAGEAPAAAPPPGAADTPAQPTQAPTRPPAAAPQVGPEKEQEPADFASRLMKAKKRVWEERDKDKQG